MTHIETGQRGLHEHSYNSTTALDKRYTVESKTPSGWLVVASYASLPEAGVKRSTLAEGRVFDTKTGEVVVFAPDGTYRVCDGYIIDAGLTTGYVVANGWAGLKITNDRVTMDELRTIAIASKWDLFGVWTDPESGAQYIDPVWHISDSSRAISLAASRKEKAIWDVRNKVEIYL